MMQPVTAGKGGIPFFSDGFCPLDSRLCENDTPGILLKNRHLLYSAEMLLFFPHHAVGTQAAGEVGYLEAVLLEDSGGIIASLAYRAVDPDGPVRWQLI